MSGGSFISFVKMPANYQNQNLIFLKSGDFSISFVKMPAYSQYHSHFFEARKFTQLVSQNADVFSTPLNNILIILEVSSSRPRNCRRFPNIRAFFFLKPGCLNISFVKMPASSQYQYPSTLDPRPGLFIRFDIFSTSKTVFILKGLVSQLFHKISVLFLNAQNLKSPLFFAR